MVLNCVVSISFGYILYCVCFNLYCGGFKLFCNVCARARARVCVCVCVSFVMCGCYVMCILAFSSSANLTEVFFCAFPQL